MRRIALLLLDAGCGVDLANEDGVTSLTLAAQNGSVSLMKVLMDRGAALIPESVANKIVEGEKNILHSFTQVGYVVLWQSDSLSSGHDSWLILERVSFIHLLRYKPNLL